MYNKNSLSSRGESVNRGVASGGGGGGGKECVGPRGLGGPRSPGHREDRDIPFE